MTQSSKRIIHWFGKVLAWLLAVAITLFEAAKMIRDPSPTKGDFGVYLHGSRLLMAGENIYAIRLDPGNLYYIYPPFLAFLMTPLTFVPIEAAIVLWCLITSFLTGWIVVIFYEIVAKERFFDADQRVKWLVGGIPILFTLKFLLHNLDRGQVNVLQLALIVLAIKLAMSGDAIKAGMVYGISLVLKPIGIAFMIPLIIFRRVRIMFGTVAGVLAALALPAVIVGFLPNIALIRAWMTGYLLDTAARESKLGIFYNSSIKGVLIRLFSSTPAFDYNGQTIILTIYELSPFTIDLIDWGIRLALMSLIALVWYKFGKSDVGVVRSGLFAFTLAVSPILFPTAQRSYFVFLLPAYIYVVYAWFVLNIRDRMLGVLIVSSVITGTILTDSFSGKMLNNYFVAFGFVIWTSILVAIAVLRVIWLEDSNKRTRCVASEFEN